MELWAKRINLLIKEKVECLTLNSLLKKYGVKKIDFLQIDAESYDYYILKQIPFNEIKPSMIMYEYINMTKRQEKYIASYLTKKGYSIIKLHIDCFAYLNENL